MFGKHAALNGAWEEPGVIGTRIEINGRRLTVLWRSAPVLQTTFRVANGPEGLVLRPAQNSLCYAGESKPYAVMTGLVYRDGTLVMDEQFPISGASRRELKPTRNTRYGGYTVDDRGLAILQGTWRDEQGFFTLTFAGNTLHTGRRTVKVHTLRPLDDASGQWYKVADEDPAVTGWDGLEHLILEGDRLTGCIPVCDAPAIDLVFTKTDA